MGSLFFKETQISNKRRQNKMLILYTLNPYAGRFQVRYCKYYDPYKDYRLWWVLHISNRGSKLERSGNKIK